MALSYALSQPREVAIVGDPDATDTQALLVVARGGPPLPCCRAVVRWMDGPRPMCASIMSAARRPPILRCY
jgi:hypothetical protein